MFIMKLPAVERVGNRVHLKSEFKDKDVAKGIIGARWSPKDRVWTYPLDLETCRRLRDAFGPRLNIGPELWSWAAAQRAKEDDLSQLNDISKIDITKVVDLPTIREAAPTMWAAMQQRPYQPVAAKYMAEAQRCLNADQPGIGKTIETLGALIERGVTGPVLVLAPKTSALTVWPVEIERWLADDVPYTITQMAGLTPAKRDAAWEGFMRYITDGPEDSVMDPVTGKQKLVADWEARDGIHFLIANAEQAGIKKFTVCPAGICDGDEDWCSELAQHKNASEVRRPFLHSIEWSAIIADETHKWLINTRGKSASQVGYGFTKLRCVEDGPMYALSGTPLKGKKWNLFGTLNWLWPKTYTSKWRWIESYFEVVNEKVDAGRKGIIETKEITGKWKSDKDKEAFFRSLQSVMIRRTKDELRRINPAWMPPEKRYHDVWVDMEGSQRAHYRAMEKDAAVTLGEHRLTATGVLAEMTRLKQFANSDGDMVSGKFQPTLPSAKFNWLLQFLEERGIEAGGDLSDDVRKVVVASQFTTLIHLWWNSLREKGIEALTLTGETSDRDRSSRVGAFQTNPNIRVFLINTTAGGVSITLDAADDIVLMDETWVPDDQEQVEDRVHRASNVTHQVDVWYVRTKGTIEEGIAQTSAEKAESNHVVLDAQRGLRFAVERFGAIVKEKS
jgi:SNF2 family DNA or RNA helicase